MIDVCLLGCGGAMPIPQRYLSATLIRYKGKMILIDCGEGTQVSMKLLGWGFKHIDVICLTHLHGDHIYGLPGLLSTMSNSGRTDSLTIIGPERMSHLVKDLKVLLPYLPFELIGYENIKQFHHHDIEISTLKLDHSSLCLGYSFMLKRSPQFDVKKAVENDVPKRIWNVLQKGNTITYEDRVYTPEMVLGQSRSGIKISITTDTRPTKEIPSFIKESDLFICEGSYGDDLDFEKAIRNKHMTFKEASTLAKDGNVKELLLTHFSPSVLEPELYLSNATDTFLNTTIGVDRLTRSYNFVNKT